jgi:MoaA/NifB/PqqE/SkfB family radical SAM enzyme
MITQMFNPKNASRKNARKFMAGVKSSVVFNLIKLSTSKIPLKKCLRNLAVARIKHKMFEKIKSTYFESEYIARVVGQFVINIVNQLMKNCDRGFISKKYVEKSWEIFMKNMLESDTSEKSAVKKKYIEKYNVAPPGFFTISPTQKCNLRCIGCYAESQAQTMASLPYWVVEKAIREMRDICDSTFVVVSGGEPFVWNEAGKDIISIAETFQNMFFLVFTNGLLLYGDRLERMAETGNITPAISVEGFEKETDDRRGKGVFKQILENIEHLKKIGIPFGISVTATKKNINSLLEDKFYEYWFDEVGATYMWMFHLMPIGRAKDTMDLVLSPEERVNLLKEWEHIMFDKGYFVGDFWNAGAGSRGCMAYAREGGYFHIDWNGNIMPCVFIPYYKDNIIELYQNDKTIVDALMSDFFTRGRSWQEEYGYLKDPSGNFFAPCSIRDNYKCFREKILSDDIKPENENAKIALHDPEYFEKMAEFGEKIRKLTKPLWDERHKKSKEK